jgi:hypothetical protein
LVRSEVEDLRDQLRADESPAGGVRADEAGEEAATAIAPLTRAVGNWNLASTGTGDQEAAALDAPVEIDQFENTLHAGGRVMVTTFSGRFREGVEAGGASVSAGEQFAGFFALAYDAANNRYTQLYADDQGKVATHSTERWEAEGETLRLYFDGEDESGGFVAEFVNQGPARLSYNLYEAPAGRRGTEAGRGTLIKSATLKRK